MNYRLPKLEDKNEMNLYIAEHYSHGEQNLSASNGLTDSDYESWVIQITNNVNISNGDWGKSYTYLVFDKEKLVGLLSIRHDLTKELAEKFGHIGYGVRPSERCKGYATKMLNYALQECKKLGLEKVILGCYKQNVGSAKTIIKNGGKLIKEVDDIVCVNGFYDINLISQYYEINLTK